MAETGTSDLDGGVSEWRRNRSTSRSMGEGKVSILSHLPVCPNRGNCRSKVSLACEGVLAKRRQSYGEGME